MFYTIFGITFYSEIALPECLPTHSTTSEVEILVKKDIKNLSNPIVKKSYYQIGHQSYVVDIGGVAKFGVFEGKRIEVQIHDSPASVYLNKYLLSRVMSVLLYQRKMMPLAAATVLINNVMVVLTGPSLYATKILPAYLAQLGCTTISSYLSPLSILSEKSLPWCGYGISNTPMQLHDKKTSTVLIIELSSDKQLKHMKTEAVTGMEKLQLLSRNLFYKEVFGPLNQQELFQVFSNLPKNLRFLCLTLPVANFTLETLGRTLFTLSND